MQWNLSITDTLGPEKQFVIQKFPLFRRYLICTAIYLVPQKQSVIERFPLVGEFVKRGSVVRSEDTRYRGIPLSFAVPPEMEGHDLQELLQTLKDYHSPNRIVRDRARKVCVRVWHYIRSSCLLRRLCMSCSSYTSVYVSIWRTAPVHLP